MKRTNALNQSVKWQYEYNSGKPVEYTDANLVNTAYAYDDLFDRLTQIRKAAGVQGLESQTNVAYSSPTDVNVYNDQKSTGDQALHAESIYDGFGRLKESRTWESSTTYISTDKTYDALGRVYSVSNPYRTSSDVSYGLTMSTYDSLGRVTLQQNPDGSTKQWQYVGPQVTSTDESGNQWQHTPMDGTIVEGDRRFCRYGALNFSTTYTYDALDDLTGVNQSGMVRTFAYDSLKRLLAASNPENASAAAPAQLTCAGATGSKWTACYGYDNVGNLLTKRITEERQPRPRMTH